MLYLPQVTPGELFITLGPYYMILSMFLYDLVKVSL